MGTDRRTFLRIGLSTAASMTGRAAGASPQTSTSPSADDHVGVLVDTTLCIGCRKCEEACHRANRMPQPERPFSDVTVLRSERRPTDAALTVVNAYPGSPSPDQTDAPETYVKAQCMHCLDPACVSACIVGALTKRPDGTVVYDPSICIGCRYCFLACPFEILAYEYGEALTPRVRKCELCVGTDRGPEANPACAAACPTEALVFGRRANLLELAHARIDRHPGRYLPTIYGEHEVGGCGWLYLVGRPHDELGLLTLPAVSPSRLTERIQHTLYRYGALPLALYGLLGLVMWRHRRHRTAHGDLGSPGEPDSRGAPPETGA
jgi:Fe-S-cluster-containing dehydrogenase component